MRLKAYGLSDIGRCRQSNQDEWIALPEIGFFALADGMGGQKAGDIAAKETIRHLSHLAQDIQTTDCVELIIELRHAIEKTNAQVFQMGRRNESLSGMGTTLCCILWRKNAIIYAHAGDSRVYRCRKGKLEQLTQDHSLLAKWLATGKLAEECETPFPYKNVITRAIGTSKKANAEIAFTTHLPGDIYFLCSDGISDVLSLQEMEKIIASTPSLKELVNKLIEKAKNKGGSDNMTILMIEEDGEYLPR